jgi:Amt family ammonium transporter
MGVIGWTLFSYFKHGRKFSVIGACEGAIAGLVGITPAAGYVSPWFGALIGFLTAIVVCAFENVNEWLGIDDGLEVFKLHGIGGMCGAFLTGIFATEWVSALDGIPTLAPGAIDGNGIQVAKQLAEIAAIAGWSFTCSFIMLTAMKYIPGLHLRVHDDIEEIGLDLDQFHDETIGEWALFETEDLHRRRSTVHGVPVANPETPPSESTAAEKSTEETKQD